MKKKYYMKWVLEDSPHASELTGPLPELSGVDSVSLAI